MIAYLDCFSGVSGDKLLAACIDAGAPADRIEETLRTLGITGWRLEVEPAVRSGFEAKAAVVRVAEVQPSRDWGQIRALISRSALSERVRQLSLAVFEVLARAEAEVHGVPLDQVHFHEVGAVDSIVDVVGCVAAFELLGVGTLVCSPIALGAGLTPTGHGPLPVPAPATLRILEGVPVYGGPEAAELTTPTGAALVRVLADSFGNMPAMVPVRTGLGAGSRETVTPNVLRLVLGRDAAGDTALAQQTVVTLRTVLDHRTPEEIAHALDLVREAGALDAWQQPVTMKKGRLGVEVTVLASPADADRLAEVLVRETGTLGVRREFADRLVAQRTVVELETSWGRIRFKVFRTDAGAREVRPEYDDVARLSREHHVPMRELEEALTREATRLLGDEEPPGKER